MTRLYIAGGLILAIVLLGATCLVLRARIAAQDSEIVSLTEQRQMAAADARRWQDAALQRQAIIDRQALALRRLESDGRAARSLAVANADQAARKIAALETRLSQIKEAAHAKPEDVRPLGPIVRDALRGLRD